jgi:hypothetical protein
VTTLPAGTELRWSNGTTVYGTLTTNGATAGASSIQLNAGSFATIIPVGDTFTLPAFVMYASAQTTLNGSGAGSVPVIKNVSDTTPSSIADGAVISTRICPDFYDTDFGGDGVLRLRGSNTTAPTYKQSARYLVFSPIARIMVPAGETKALYFAVGVTRWAAERQSTTIDEMWVQLWDADSRELLDTVQMSTTMTDPIPFEIDGSVYQHLTVTLDYTLTQSRRVEVCLAPSSGYPAARGAFLYLRWAALWTGSAAVPPVLGSHSNAMYHRAQDVLEASRNAARYAVTLSRDADDSPLLLQQTVRLVAPEMSLDTDLSLERLNWHTHDPNDVSVELARVAPRLSDDAFTEQ